MWGLFVLLHVFFVVYNILIHTLPFNPWKGQNSNWISIIFFVSEIPCPNANISALSTTLRVRCSKPKMVKTSSKKRKKQKKRVVVDLSLWFWPPSSFLSKTAAQIRSVISFLASFSSKTLRRLTRVHSLFMRWGSSLKSV